MKKINLVIITDILYGDGGTEVNLFRLLTNLDRKVFNLFVCPLEPESSPMIDSLRQNGIQVHPFPVKRIYDLNALLQAVKLKKFLKDKEVDIVQTIHFNSDIWGTLVARWAGVATAISSRRDLGCVESSWRHRILRRLINGFPDKIIANSYAVKKHVMTTEKVSDDRITTIYNGLDARRFNCNIMRSEKMHELGLNPDLKLVGTIANIRPVKGLEFFIQAAGIILQQRPDTQFIIVGGDAIFSPDLIGYKQRLKKIAKEAGVEERLFYLGMRSDIPEILAALDVYVSSSLSEGFSNVLLEAMASGKPVVATDVGGNAEAVFDETCGFIVPPRNSIMLAERVIELLRDEKRAAQFGREGRERVELLFSIEKQTAEYTDLYRSFGNGFAELFSDKCEYSKS